MIDIEKFICSLLNRASGLSVIKVIDILNALNNQGLDYKDGKIVNVEPKAESWTIQDAEDGDVLADGNAIILFKSIRNKDYNNVIDYYAYTGVSGEFVVQKGGHYWGYTHDCTLSPSTKEQRKGFFAAMHDAGYEWDSENKQLKKVEKKEELTEFENIVEEIADTSILNAYGVKELAKRLLPDAKKQLQEEYDKQLELAYKNADKVQYKRGYRKAIEDAWEYFSKGLPNGCRDVVKQYFDKGMEQKLKELSQG